MQEKTAEMNIDPNCIDAQRKFLLLMKDDFDTRQQIDVRLRAVEIDVSKLNGAVDGINKSVHSIQASLTIREQFDKRLEPLLDKFEKGMTLKTKAGNWAIGILIFMSVSKLLPAQVSSLISAILLKMAGG